MTTKYETEEITQHGHTYQVDFYYDPESGAPWDAEDSHGPVSPWVNRGPNPGERVLSKSGSARRYYDFAAALVLAKEERWGNADFDKTPEQIAVEATEQDFELLKAWCDSKWQYIGIRVTRLCECCGNGSAAESSLWDLRSCDLDYETILQDLIGECDFEANNAAIEVTGK